MARFQFRLEALLRFRENQRDLVRQQLAQLLSQDENFVAQRDSLLQERVETVQQLAELQRRPQIDVSSAAARRFHAGQLLHQARQVERERQALGEQIVKCRQALVLADQGVKVLEQLQDRQRTEFEAILEQKENRQREEVWQAGRLTQMMLNRQNDSDQSA